MDVSSGANIPALELHVTLFIDNKNWMETEFIDKIHRVSKLLE
jgi:hypothetical protein